MKKRVFILSAFLLLVMGGGLYYFLPHKGGDKGAANATEMRAAAPPPAVSVVTLAEQKILFSHTLPGRVSAYRQSQVRPQVNGIITKRLFEEGQTVEQGQQLYQIDDARYLAALNSAIADLKSAEANVKAVESRAKRYEDLVKIDAVSQQEYDDIRAQLDQAKAAIAVAQAAVDMAQVNLDYTKVYAPISGRIGRSVVTEGALVTANQAQHLAVITQLDPIYVDMQQSGAEAIKLRTRMIGKAEMPVRLVLDEATGKNYSHIGVLKFSEVTVDETTGAVALRALMPNPDDILLPGLFVRAELELGEETVLLVPQRATTRLPGGDITVWVVDENNQAQSRKIDVDLAHEDNWIVSSGLQPGDRVIVEGYQRVGPGAPVTPSPWVKKNGTAAPAASNEQNSQE